MADADDGVHATAGTDEVSLGDLVAAVVRHNHEWHAPDRLWTPASIGARVGATAIDVTVFIALTLVLSIAFVYTMNACGPLFMAHCDGWVLLLILEAVACLYLALDVRGRTLGKALVGLYPTSDVSTRSRRPLVVRWALRCLPLFVAMALAAGALIYSLCQNYFAFVSNVLDETIGGHLPITLVAMFVFMVVPTGARRQSWYDRVARTDIMRPGSGVARVRGFEPILPSGPPPQ